MAVKTGAIFNSLTFGGVNSADYGIYITGEAVYNAPERAVEMVSVAGRNGAIAIDQGHWNNIEVTYPAGTFGKTQAEFREAISAFRNAILSQLGYQRLTDTYHPDEYRMALYVSGLEVEPTQYGSAAEFKLQFNCKPQRWLTEGEQEITVGEWGETETATGETVTIENPNGNLSVKSLTVDLEPIQDLNGYDKPWVGGAGKNKLPNITSQIAGSGITATWQTDGTLKLTGTASGNVFIGIAFSIVAGSYVLSGCPSGGGDSTYQLDIRSSVGSGVLYSRDIGSGLSFSPSADLTAYVNIRVANGYACPSGGLIFKPMIRKSTESDDFAPYENICPISGTSEVKTIRSGKNLCDTSLVYDGYINASQQKILSNANARTLYLPCKPSTTYTVSKQAGQRFIVAETTELPTNNVVVSNIVSDYTASSITITTTASAKYLVAFVYLSTADTGVTADQMLATCQIELGSTATDYESYQGTTYTTSLGRTVYAGTLDVVSGVLTVTDANIASYNGETLPSTWISDRDVYASGATPTTGAQVVYKLSSPQAYQLTAQQIELLTGTNNIWSDGDVTVEYGQDPDALYNPTPYDASPLLAVEGYGTIEFNGYEIEIADGTYGEIPILDNAQKFKQTFSMVIPNEYIKEGDTVTVFGLDTYSKGAFYRDSSDEYRYAHYYPEIGSAPRPVDSDAIAVTSYARAPEGALYSNNGFDCRTKFSNLSFVIGTSHSFSDTYTITGLAVYRFPLTMGTEGEYVGTLDVSHTITASYDAATQTIEITQMGTATGAGANRFKFTYTQNASERSVVGPVVIDSTLTYLGDPTYIDCDLGDAYKIKDGTYISLNSYIDLGSDLPVLASGNNPVTMDNTITELKIVPRYWIL